ncbi:MAG: DUF3791 domain-containing protein [Oscillospiraceae bacterium]|nr:DUF3791 domain-containing protein [Oscillospiraceae bacterium]
MSELSFVTFCVEYYAEHTNQPSEKVYELFKKEKVLDMLRDDYDDLHGMSMEYMMQLIDWYLGEKKTDSHALIKATLIPEIVRMISEKYNISEEEAMDEFYASGTAEALSDSETGLYGQSALFIFGLFCEEKAE